MKKKTRIALVLLLAVVFAGSLIMFLSRNADYKKGEEAYSEAEALAALPDLSDLPAPQLDVPAASAPDAPADPDAPAEPEPEKVVYVDPYADALRAMDFAALREVNEDVLGWILIPGTAVSYPLVQGEDNQYYLNRTWKTWRSAVGSIFMECRSSRDLSDFNTVIYGHRMNNGSMFAALKYYKKQSYWEAHPCVYITDDNGTHKYDIFSAYEAKLDGPTYQIGFSGDASKQKFLDECAALSVIDTGVVPTIYDRVVTLSTCTGRGHETRWVVQAVLKSETPKADLTQEELEEEVLPTEQPEPAVTDGEAAEPAEEIAPPQENTRGNGDPETERGPPAEEPVPEDLTEQPAETAPEEEEALS